jgi:hypothetical protein
MNRLKVALIFWKLIYFMLYRIPVFHLQVKVKVKFTLEQATKAQNGGNLGARWGWVVNATPLPLYPREREPVPIVWRLGGPQGRS